MRNKRLLMVIFIKSICLLMYGKSSLLNRTIQDTCEINPVVKKVLIIIIFVLPAFLIKAQQGTKQVNQIITFRLNMVTVINFSGKPSVRSISSREFLQTEKNIIEPDNYLGEEVFVVRNWVADYSGRPVQTLQKSTPDNPFYFTSSELSANRNMVLYTATSH